MLTIQWKGKIGYGDIISPIGYAHNEAQRRQEDVTLNFYFEHSPGIKFKESDPETINDRIDFIAQHTRVDHGQKVTVNQIYNTRMKENHTNYSDQPLGLHNLTFSDKYAWNSRNLESNQTILITPESNKKQFSEYAPQKQWKDIGGWDEIREKIENDPHVAYPIDIGYHTPIEKASKALQKCRQVISYHGNAAWLARWVGAPMWVRSNKPEFSQQIFPWSDPSWKYSIAKKLEVIDLREEYL